MQEKLRPLETAKKFVNNTFPNCQGALLAGSVVRGEETVTSDLDIVVIDDTFSTSYRESFIQYGWPIEVFVHNTTSYHNYFENDYNRARPSLPRMVAEGIVLKDVGVIDKIKIEAKQLLEKGPKEWSIAEITMKRYFITDLLDDLVGSTIRSEEIFITNKLAEMVSEFVLRTNKQWLGNSKWVVRALNSYDRDFTQSLVEAFDLFYKTGNKTSIILLVDEVLSPFGGRLFEGFSLGK